MNEKIKWNVPAYDEDGCPFLQRDDECDYEYSDCDLGSFWVEASTVAMEKAKAFLVANPDVHGVILKVEAKFKDEEVDPRHEYPKIFVTRFYENYQTLANPYFHYEFQIYPRHYAATFFCDLLSEWVEQ